MKNSLIAVIAATLMISVLAADAIEQDATMITSAAAKFISYKDQDGMLMTAMGEVAVHGAHHWTIVTGAGGGMLSHAGVANPDLWYLMGGVRLYFTDYASITFAAEYEWANSGTDYKAFGGTVSYRQRLLPAERPISPFFIFAASSQSVRATSWVGDFDSVSVLLLELGMGCDFSLGQDLSLVLQGTVRDSSKISDGLYGSHYADGWTASLALKYYWF